MPYAKKKLLCFLSFSKEKMVFSVIPAQELSVKISPEVELNLMMEDTCVNFAVLQ